MSTGYLRLYDRQRPAAVARCVRAEDVQACVEFAAANRIPVAARAGGHSYAGYSSPDGGLVIDLRALNSVDPLPGGRAVVGGGALLGEVYTELGKVGRALPGGTCATVGVGGLTLGGGIGVLSRKYGLTCDRVTSMRVVTPDGCLRTAAPGSEPELFWALRGGGGGNLGVVTSFTFSTAPAREASVFTLTFPISAVGAMLAAWQDWIPTLPDEMSAALGVPGGGAATFAAEGCFVGTARQARPWVDDLIRRIGSQPLTREEQDLTHVQAMQHFAGCADLGGASCRPSWGGQVGGYPRNSYVGASRMLTAPLRDPQAVADLITGPAGLYTIFDTLGGAVGRGESAYPHRAALSIIQVLHDVGGAAGDEPTVRHTVGQVRDELTRHTGATGYVNYMDPQMPDWAHAYYGASLPRLRRAARRYDPDRVFAFPQGLVG
ncbi:FAD-dependent oxidoreductase [Kutzneria albida]|uniref:FAD-binding PCMH-type domain-containing protein n=1 Tax=Kutzneria albida DSM 43870 TaxID=1449976 RepID=W5VZ39_9PSEU|nr:FAD-dependent oxidoreductase [Kutzneria albida]AHH93566.1 hypothetical protein KALB_189 [Kutzneria albida DSM 43870]